MTSWPSVQISAPADDAIIDLQQTYPTTIDCNIEQPGDARNLILTNCAASADCLTLAAQTKWLFFTVDVSIDLAAGFSGSFADQVADDAKGVPPNNWTATINADGSTQHVITQADFNAAVAFIKACKLPAISPNFTVGRIQEPRP